MADVQYDPEQLAQDNVMRRALTDQGETPDPDAAYREAAFGNSSAPSPIPGAPGSGGGGAPELSTNADARSFLTGIVPNTATPTAPPQTNTAQDIAQNAIKAGQQGADWKRGILSAALSTFAEPTKVPEGGGALYGIEHALASKGDQLAAKKQTAQDQQLKQQQLDLEKQRLGMEDKNQDRDYQLKVAENGRQQAESIARMAEHDKRLVQMDDEHNVRNFDMMKADVDFRNSEIEREETIKKVGGKPLQVGGVDAPAFKDLGEAENFANDNQMGSNAHTNGYRDRIVYGADHQYHIYEVPDEEEKQFDVTDAKGKKQKIWSTPLGVLNYQDKVSEIRERDARTTLSYAEAKKQIDDYKDAGTAKKARANLDKVGGDYSKLSDGDKEALMGDAQKRFTLNYNAAQGALKDMKADPDYAGLPTLANGSVDTKSQQYTDLATKYHVNEASDMLGQTYDELRQLGHGYKPFGGSNGQPNQNAPQPGANSPEAAVAAAKKDAALQTASDQAAEKRKQDLDKLGALTSHLGSGGGRSGPAPNPEYNKQLDDLIKAHPDWSDDEKIRAMNAMVGQPNPQAAAPNAPQGAPQKGDQQTYNGANYTFDGSQWVKK